LSKLENLRLYLKQIHSAPSLTEEEKEKLFKKLNNKGKKSEAVRNKLIQDNLALVVNLAKRYYYPGMNMEFLDFIEEGNIVLVKAVERFDYSKGFKFSTYASWWIEKHFQEAFLKSRSIVQIPEKIWRHLKKVEEMTNRLLHETGHAPNIQELSKQIDITISELRDTLHAAFKMKNIKSLDYYIDDDESRTLESIVATQEITDDELVDKLARKEQVLDLLSNLDYQERQVLELRFALQDNKKHTFNEIGKMLKMSPSKAKETLDRAIRKLRRIALFNKME